MKNLTLVKQIAKEINEQGGTMYFVGGMVRDSILGLDNKDIDVEIHNISVEDTTKIIAKYGHVIEVGASFGILMLNGVDVDFAFPRIENKTGDKHVDFSVSVDPYMGVHTAAKRRDFTMNALMQNVLTGEIIDPYDGLKAIASRTISYVNKKTYIEDPLRSMRAAQFASRLNFTVDDLVIEVAKEMDYSDLSSERIYTELNKALLSQKPSTAIKHLKEMSVLDAILPALNNLNVIQFNDTMTFLDDAVHYREQTSNPLAFMYTVLFNYVTDSKTEFSRISINSQSLKYLKVFEQYRADIYSMTTLTDYKMRKLMYSLPIRDAMALFGITSVTSHTDMKTVGKQVAVLSMGEYGKIEHYYTGKKLIEMGFKPGPYMGKLLRDLFEQQLNGATKLELEKYIISLR